METNRVMRATLAEVREVVDHFMKLRKGLTPRDVWDSGGFNVVRSDCERTAYRVLNDPNGVILFTPHAIMAGQIEPYPFNFSVRIATEIIFQSDGQDGPLVLCAFEGWAREKGATCVMTSVEPIPEREDAQAKAMNRFGYQLVENAWRKWLV